MSAVHPDLFLTQRVSEDSYIRVLEELSAVRYRFPKTPADIHAFEIPKKLPRLFEQHKVVLGVLEPGVPLAGVAKLSFRGVCCTRCTRPITDDESLRSGLGPECRKQ